MSEALRISVAEDEPHLRQYFQEILPLLGHKVVSVAATGRELVEHCKLHSPDLVISDIRMPDMDGLDAAAAIYAQRPLPIILISGYADTDFITRAQANHVLGYLIKPIKQSDLVPAIAIAMRRFEEFERLRKEAADLRQALEDRKLIERAKGLLMKKAELDEPEAFRRLQRLARDTNRKLADVASMIVLAEEALSPRKP